jgi:hypothetical protein
VADAELITMPAPAEAVWRFLDEHVPTHAGFESVRAAGRVPNPRPRRFTRVRNVGGASRDIVSFDATVTVESYASTDDDAEAIARLNLALLQQAAREGWLGPIPVRDITCLSTPQILPDPTTEQTRSTATYVVALRGSRA